MVSQWNFSGIFPRIHHIAALLQSPRVTVKIERNTRIFLIDGSSSCRMFNDISWGSKDNEQECESSAKLVSIYAKKIFHQEDGHSSDLHQKRSGILLMNANRKENGTESQS